MTEVGRPGEHLPRLEAIGREGVTIVAGTEDEIVALQGLTLTVLRQPLLEVEDIRLEIDRFDRTEQRYTEIGRASLREWEEEIGRVLTFAYPNSDRPEDPPKVAPVTALVLALATGIELWREESKRGNGQLLLALTIATPESSDAEGLRLEFERPRAALVIRNHWPDVRLVVDSFLSGKSWLVSLFRGSAGRLRSADAAAAALVTNLRSARQAAVPKPHPLARLGEEDITPHPVGSTGVIVFLHGLISTDLGTFDGFIRRWLNPRPTELPPALLKKRATLLAANELPQPARKAIGDAVPLVGWPHDTLISIEQNALDLASAVRKALSDSSCSVAFVCHSRGGVVARAAAEILFDKDEAWCERICRCITFGSPHAGVALAEHPDRQLGIYMLAGLARKQLSAFVDIAAYLEQREKIEGIEDLRPTGASGVPFLRKLQELELAKAPKGRDRRLNVYAIGGVAQLGAGQGSLLERLGRLYDTYIAYYSGQSEHDLVVPLSSATKVNSYNEPATRTSCDHFSYFSDGGCAEAAIAAAIRLLWEDFKLTDRIASHL